MTDAQIDKLIDYGLAGGFRVFFQPIYEPKRARFTKAEALIRLTDSDGVQVAPLVFIPRMEQTGRIKELGLYVLSEVCRVAGNDDDGTVYAMNVSPAELYDPSFAQNVLSIIEEKGVDENRVVFEVTETSDYESDGTIGDNLNMLKRHGLRISLDDVGTGFSDLKKLNNLPLSFVKLDKYYIDKLIFDYSARLAVSALIKFAQRKGLETVAEGVEHPEQRRLLEQMECDFLQGFLLARPMCEADWMNFKRKVI